VEENLGGKSTSKVTTNFEPVTPPASRETANQVYPRSPFNPCDVIAPGTLPSQGTRATPGFPSDYRLRSFALLGTRFLLFSLAWPSEYFAMPASPQLLCQEEVAPIPRGRMTSSPLAHIEEFFAPANEPLDWRRGRDSNSRSTKWTPVFKTGGFNRSPTPP
jgi:hypothetical protein